MTTGKTIRSQGSDLLARPTILELEQIGNDDEKASLPFTPCDGGGECGIARARQTADR